MGNSNISYRNVLHLAVIIEEQLKKDRPDYQLEVTSNPGDASEHYIGLVQRIYKMRRIPVMLKNGTKATVTSPDKFVGYITYRYNEVRYASKMSNLPVFSSIEVRDPDFNPLPTPIKVHFSKKKVCREDPDYVKQAEEDANLRGLDESQACQEFWKGRLKTAYSAILGYIDSRP